MFCITDVLQNKQVAQKTPGFGIGLFYEIRSDIGTVFYEITCVVARWAAPTRDGGGGGGGRGHPYWASIQMVLQHHIHQNIPLWYE